MIWVEMVEKAIRREISHGFLGQRVQLAVSLFGGRSGCQWHSGRAFGSSWKSLPGEHGCGSEGDEALGMAVDEKAVAADVSDEGEAQALGQLDGEGGGRSPRHHD